MITLGIRPMLIEFELLKIMDYRSFHQVQTAKESD